MQDVGQVVLIGCDVVVSAVNVEGAVLDAIGITTRYTSQMGVHLALVSGGLVKAEDNVAFYAILALDEQVGHRSAVGDERCADTLGRDMVLAIRIRAKTGTVGGGGSFLVRVCERCRSKQEESSRRPHLALVNHDRSEEWS